MDYTDIQNKNKECKDCEITKIYTSEFFVKDNRTKSGLTNKCKDCHKKAYAIKARLKGIGRRKRFTFKDVKDYVSEINESLLLTDIPDSNFIKTIDYFEFQCKCGELFERRFNKFKDAKQHKCRKCSNEEGFNKQRKKQSDFIKELKLLKGEEFQILSEYLNYNSKVKMKHEVCGMEFETTPSQMLSQNQGCPICKRLNVGERLRKTHQDFSFEFKSILGEEYELLSEYTTRTDPINILHKTCKTIYKTTPACVLVGCGCSNAECISEKLKKTSIITHDEYMESIKDVIEDEYLVIGEYINTATPIEILHKKCNKSWLANTSHFRNGTRCPRCKESKGEKVISNFLDKRNIKYVSQFKTELCKNINPLPFDFAINKDDFIFLIEYDGKQHFEAIDFFGGEEGFIKRKNNDSLKNQFGKMDNIHLLRIPYWEFDNIENILENELNTFGLLESAN